MEQETAPFSFFQKQRSEKHRKEGKTGVMFDIQEELKKLPGKPGVYIMHDAKDTIIYVGKAISLKNRVRQYFQSSRNLGIKKEQMVQQIARFEYIITDSELEALVLECNLIKEHRPKYNTMLKDDISTGTVCAADEKGQSKIFRTVHQFQCGQGFDGADPQALPCPYLQPESATGYRQGAPLPVLSHQTV